MGELHSGICARDVGKRAIARADLLAVAEGAHAQAKAVAQIAVPGLRDFNGDVGAGG